MRLIALILLSACAAAPPIGQEKWGPDDIDRSSDGQVDDQEEEEEEDQEEEDSQDNEDDFDWGDEDEDEDQDDEGEESADDSEEDDVTEEEDPDPEPVSTEVVNDCTEADNDDLDSASTLLTDDTHRTYEDLELCAGDYDVYRLEIPAYTWVSFSVEVDGSGSGSSDFDIYDIENPSDPVDSDLDYITESGSLNILGYSASEQDFERLAWYNPGGMTLVRYVYVLPYDSAEGTYDIRIRTSEWHDTDDCDAEYSDDSEDGPCNRIMQFPQAADTDQGYLVTHEAHYSNLRREVAYLVASATQSVQATFSGTKPLALMDMGQADGDTPGRMVDSLRHPDGTHIEGNDIDIAYYQTGDDNLGREVCESDGYFCTGPATLLEPRRTAYFMAMLMRSDYIRVIGVDPEIAEEVQDAASDLRSEGLLLSSDISNLNTYMAYGDGWPFHHHHMHLSWSWESGHSGLGLLPDLGGCEFSLERIPAAKPMPTLGW